MAHRKVTSSLWMIDKQCSVHKNAKKCWERFQKICFQVADTLSLSCHAVSPSPLADSGTK